jgi:glycosyltransferase involved in cell wall biosynthesis
MTAYLPHRETLVFLATYNELSNIKRLIDVILTLPISCDVLVVDDNSPDATGEYLKERTANCERITLISRSRRLGVGSAHRLGWLYARRLGYAKIVTLDADLSHDPLDVLRLVAALDAGADIAFGSRFIPGGKLDHKGWRLFLSWTANTLARRLLRLSITEYTTSFRAARLDRVPFGLIESVSNDGYAFFLTAAVRLVRQGLRIKEIPIHFYQRRSGRSKMPKLEILRAAVNLLYLAFHGGPFKSQINVEAPVSCNRCGNPYVVRVKPTNALCLLCMNASA